MQENVYRLDVRIHHRISDVQKHLLDALVILHEKCIESNGINVTSQQKLKMSIRAILSM